MNFIDKGIKGIKKEFLSQSFLFFMMSGILTILFNFLARFFFQLFFPYVASVFLSAILANIVNFFINKYFTFKASSGDLSKQLIRFVIAAGVGILLTTVLSYGIVSIVKFFSLLGLTEFQVETGAHFISLAFCSTVYGYLATKYFVYKVN